VLQRTIRVAAEPLRTAASMRADGTSAAFFASDDALDDATKGNLW
jgi:hypothetical protein